MKENIKKLLDAKVHLGHQVSRLNPKFIPFLLYKKWNGISVINLNKTYLLIKKASKFIEKINKKKGQILVVGTKMRIRSLIKNKAKETNFHYCTNRWIGGILTNFPIVQKNIIKYKRLSSSLNKKNIKRSLINKKEISNIKRVIKKIYKNFEGILNLRNIPSALIVIDSNYEKVAINEAIKMNIPIISIVDSNSNPDKIEYLIPGNDDSKKSVGAILNILLKKLKQ
jgi:small subunit ribosomal protein S2